MKDNTLKPDDSLEKLASIDTVKETKSREELIAERRRFLEEKKEGPLASIMSVKLPGFYVRLVNEEQGRNPFHLQEIISKGYEFVHPKETSLRDINGNPLEGDKVKVAIGSGKYAYLMKLPQNIRDIDTDLKNEDAMKAVQPKGDNDPISSDSKINSKITTSQKLRFGSPINKR